MLLKILIIDDEPHARELIKTYLSKMEDVEVVGECENGFDALKAIETTNPDLIFLDVQMPKITGFEVLELLKNPPAVIFTTAYDNYAIQAFEKNAVDYLLKPFSMHRFMDAVDKARQRIHIQPPYYAETIKNIGKTNEPEDGFLERVVVRKGNRIEVILKEDILYLEAQDDYVMIHARQGNFLKEQTMKYFETHLPPTEFIRIHRSYIVNISEIQSVELYAKDVHLVMLKNGEKIKTSAEGYKRLRSLL